MNDEVDVVYWVAYTNIVIIIIIVNYYYQQYVLR